MSRRINQMMQKYVLYTSINLTRFMFVPLNENIGSKDDTTNWWLKKTTFDILIDDDSVLRTTNLMDCSMKVFPNGLLLELININRFRRRATISKMNLFTISLSINLIDLLLVYFFYSIIF